MTISKFWTPEREHRLDELLAADVSRLDASRELGCTKNTVIGLLDRRMQKTKGVARARRKVVVAKKPTPDAPIVPVAPRPLYALGNHHCRWPLWDNNTAPNDKLFCGAWTEGLDEGHPYCTQHARVAYRPPGTGSFRPYYSLGGRSR